MGSREDEGEPFDIMDVERFRAVPSALFLALGSVWGIGMALGGSNDRHPVMVWLLIGVVMLGWVIWSSYFLAQRRRINRKAVQVLREQREAGTDAPRSS